MEGNEERIRAINLALESQVLSRSPVRDLGVRSKQPWTTRSLWQLHSLHLGPSSQPTRTSHAFTPAFSWPKLGFNGEGAWTVNINKKYSQWSTIHHDANTWEMRRNRGRCVSQKEQFGWKPIWNVPVEQLWREMNEGLLLHSMKPVSLTNAESTVIVLNTVMCADEECVSSRQVIFLLWVAQDSSVKYWSRWNLTLQRPSYIKSKSMGLLVSIKRNFIWLKDFNCIFVSHVGKKQ